MSKPALIEPFTGGKNTKSATVVAVSIDFDLAILELEKPFKKEYAIETDDLLASSEDQDLELDHFEEEL